MAEKQLAYRASDELFADDDPLAELARIVGYEARPVAPAAPVAPRQEPAFNLEEELLAEFERYDAPRLSPSDDIAVPPEDVALHGDPRLSPPVAQVDTHRAEPPLDDYDLVADESGVDAYVEPVELEEAPLVSLAAAPEPMAPVVDSPVEARFDVGAADVQPVDLAEELEMSIAPAVQPRPSAARSPQWAAASIRLPLANFNAKRPQDVAPPSVALVDEPSEPELGSLDLDAAHEFDMPSDLGFPTEQDRHELSVDEAYTHEAAPTVPEPLFDLAAAANDDSALQADAALTEAAYPEEQVKASDVDHLLDDILRYPMPQRPAPEVGQAEPAKEPAVAAAPIVSTVVEPVAKAPVHEAAKPAAVDSDDPFAGHEFDFDIADIELELAELNLPPETKVAPVAAAAMAAAFSASRPAPAIPTVAATALPVAPPIRPEMAARPAPAVVAPAAIPAVADDAPQADPDQALPFDPSEISDTGERVEAFEGMHVPSLPQTDHVEPVAVPTEFDFDIDAEMASLFGAPAKAEVPEPPKPAMSMPRSNVAMPASWTRNAAAKEPAAKAVSEHPGKEGEGFDEFERALEEDFRRSVREAAGPSETATRMTVEAASAGIVVERNRGRSMRGLTAGVAAIVVLGLGVYGVREWVSHGSSLGLGSGQPRIITADKDPVKVAPTDPGGKIVPNQDKAVYDRVAGDSVPAPKQKELVSSSEQPVDVVQKTLVPENEENDGDVSANATPVGETEDPRLLPNQVADSDASANDQKDTPAVSPRKVRTMIVKPDGTLVARDEAAPAVDSSVKTATASEKPASAAASTSAQVAATKLRPAGGVAPAATAPAATAAAAPADSELPSAESTPIRVVKTSKVNSAKAAGTPPDTQAAAAAPQPPVQPQAKAVQPQTQAEAPAKTAAAPAPAAKPAKPAPAPAAATAATATATATAATAADKANAHPASTQVASATPATQPVQAAPAAASGAGGYVVQIASLPSEEEARKSQASLSAKFGSVIGGHPIEVKRADIPGKGTYYRVRVVAGSKDEAAALCVRYRAAGGSCLISR